jgi:hypothetical protein
MILMWICSLNASPGQGIVRLLESLGFHGFPLFLAALAISVVILGVSYLLATWGLKSKRKS